MAKLAVALDVAVRCCVILVASLLIREFWTEDNEPDGDGFPVRLLILPGVAYVLWNLWFLARSCRTWISGSLGDSSFLALLGALSLARLIWLLPLADDWWWHHRHRLALLEVASVACAILALGEAIRLTTTRPASAADDPVSADRNGRLGAREPSTSFGQFDR